MESVRGSGHIIGQCGLQNYFLYKENSYIWCDTPSLLKQNCSHEYKGDSQLENDYKAESVFFLF